MSRTELLAGGAVSSVLGATAGLVVAVWCGGTGFACQAATLAGAVAGSYIGWRMMLLTEPEGFDRSRSSPP